MRIGLSSCEYSDIDICSEKKLFDLEYVNDVVIGNEDPNKWCVFLGRLDSSVRMFWKGLGSSECKMP